VAELRDYVRQGGRLVIAAGGSFDPAAWTETAWLDGGGILPAPLRPDTIGQLPGEASGSLRPFQLAFDTLVHDYFLIENEDRQSLADLYGVPIFFKAVDVDASETVVRQLLDAETRRLVEARTAAEEIRTRLVSWQEQEASEDGMTETDRGEREAQEQRLAELEPQWLLWNDERLADDTELPPAEVAARSLPRVLASYTNKAPFLVERNIGRGQVLLVTTGVFAHSSSASTGWNNLAATDAVLLFDRIFRSMLERTLPRRNLESVERWTLPVSPADRRNRFALARPSGTIEPLLVDALSADAYGLAVRSATQRGHYRVTAFRPDPMRPEVADVRHWEAVLAVNGPAAESELRSLDASALKERLGESNYRWIGAGEEIGLEGAGVRGQDLWRWLMAAAFVCLLFELAVLAWPAIPRRAAA
jgi:hypothetical protein